MRILHLMLQVCVIASLGGIAWAVPSAPSISPAAGCYPESDSLSVTLSADAGCTIFYTTDGSRPVCYDATTTAVYSATAQIYSGAITAANGRDDGPNAISQIMTAANEVDMYDPWYPPAEAPRTIPVIRAAAVDATGGVSTVVSASYLLGDMATRYGDTPAFSICAEWADLFDNVNGPGIYRYPTATNKAKVANAHIEFFDQAARQFAKWIELRIQGTSTLSRPKKSLRLTGWREYNPIKGKKEAFDYKFFDDKDNTKYSTVVLRMGGNDWNQGIIRDQLAQGINKHGAVDVQYGSACVVFLNGVYWGVHEIRERWEAGYFKYQQGVDEDTHFSLLEYGDGKPYPLVDQGLGEDDDDQTSQAYSNFWGILRKIDDDYNDDLADASRYAWFTNVIEPDSLMQHFGASLFTGNLDWPQNNQRWWRTWPDESGEIVDTGNPRNDGRWNWTFHDMDFALTLPFDYVPDCSSQLYSAYNTYPHIQEGSGAPFVGTFQPDAARAFNAGLSNTNFLTRYLNYLYLQFATAWRPDVTIAAMEEAANRFREAGMDENGLRWRMPGDAGAYERKLDAIRNYLTGRPAAFAWHTREKFGLGENRTLVLDKGGEGAGDIVIAGFALNSNALPGFTAMPAMLPFPTNVPVVLEARAASGSAFEGWYQTTANTQADPPVPVATDCAANYDAGGLPAESRGSGWGDWALTSEGSDSGAYVGSSDMPIHGCGANGTSFGLFAHSGQSVSLRRERADVATLDVNQTMSLDVGFGVAGADGGAGVAFIAPNDSARPVELILANGDANGESFRLLLNGQAYRPENFPYVVGAPIHLALTRTGDTTYTLFLTRAGMTFSTDFSCATPISGVRFYKNAYGDSQDKYNLFFDNLRVANETVSGESTSLTSESQENVVFYDACTSLGSFSLSVENDNGGTCAGSFMASQPLVNIGIPCVGLWANNSGISKAARNFGFALTNGNTLSFRMQNGFIDDNAGVGVDLLAADGSTSLLYLGMDGGAATYQINGTPTTVPFTTAGLPVRIDVLSDDGKSIRVTLGETDCGTFNLTAPIQGLCFMNLHAGNGTVHDFYFKDIVVTGPLGTPVDPPTPSDGVLFYETGANEALWTKTVYAGDAGGWAGGGAQASTKLESANAFYLYAGGNDSTDRGPEASYARFFTNNIVFADGIELSFKFCHGEVGDQSDSGIGSVGWNLLDSGGNELCYFAATRDSDSYVFNGEGTGASTDGSRMHEVLLSFTSGTTFNLYLDGSGILFEVSLNQMPAGIRFRNWKAGSDTERNLEFDQIRIAAPVAEPAAERAGERAAVMTTAPKGIPRATETLLSTNTTLAVWPTVTPSIIAKFALAPASDLDVWAVEQGVTNVWDSSLTTNGVSYPEYYLLETNNVSSLQSIDGAAIYSHVDGTLHGIANDIEVNEDLTRPDMWRAPHTGELSAVEGGDNAYQVSPTNGLLFIRLKLTPLAP